MRVLLKTLGCRLNEAELETWSRDFQARGHQLTSTLTDADLVVVNTCAVTGEAVRKSRKLLRRAQRDNPKAKLVVSGCYATLDPTESSETLGVDLVVDNQNKDQLVEIVSQKLNLHAMPELATEPGESLLLAQGRQRAFIKVQDGCRYRCSFCVVTLARGEERSRPIADVVEEINRLHQEGIQEVVLTGVHIGGYGSDLGINLYQLIHSILEQTGIPRLRLGSIEPWDLPGQFWDLFQNPRFMPHLHLPLQSGADSVLKRMSRRCTTQEFSHLMEEARQRVPDINITTDVIVGFPGESDQEWQQSLAFIEQMGFGHLHIFAYSPRPGTKAATLPDQLERSVIKARSQELHELGQRLKRVTLKKYLGREFPVLIEGSPELDNGGNRTWSGYTPNFLRVMIQAPVAEDLENQIHNVQLEALDMGGEHLLACLL
ncbi:tRNA (N(6)-L-threonylcarbamoyladenosine(37)-C(2))-methylthiotransferase MtaB [Pseudomonadota bacterium]